MAEWRPVASTMNRYSRVTDADDPEVNPRARKLSPKLCTGPVQDWEVEVQEQKCPNVAAAVALIILFLVLGFLSK